MLGTRGRARVVREVVGFLVVGIAATATHLSVGLAAYYALPLGLSAFEANLVAFCVAYLVTYIGNARLTFPETRLGLASFVRFLTVSLGSLGLNQAIVYVLVGCAGRPYWQALIAVLVLVPPLTFVAMKHWGARGTLPGHGSGFGYQKCGR